METINYNQCVLLCEQVLQNLDQYVKNNCDGNVGWAERDTEKVINKIKTSVVNKNFPEDMLLRAFMDVSVISARNFDNTELGESITKLSNFFLNSISSYMLLEPLGMEFGEYINS